MTRIVRQENSIVKRKIKRFIDNGEMNKVVYGFDNKPNYIFVELKCGVSVVFDTYKANEHSADVFPRCIGDIYKGFESVDLSKYKSVEDCDIRVNFGDIKRSNDNSLLSIDINRCYYNVAHKLGFISNENYERYSDKKYKKSVNIAIGKCYSHIITMNYNGEKNTKVLHPLAGIRTNILDYVANIYKEVAEKVNVIYFNTDAFHIESIDEETDKRNIEIIGRILEKYGLTYKLE